MDRFKFFTNAHGTAGVVTYEALELRMLLCQSAAALMVGCMTGDPSRGGAKHSDIGAVLAERLSWPSNVFTNALQAHAHFIYAYIKHCCESGMAMPYMEREEAEVLTEALGIYQSWKTRLCQHEQDEYGPGWGSATQFFRMNWAEHNGEFLSLWK